MPVNLNCPPDEPITFKMKNCKIIKKEGTEERPVIEADNFRDIILDNVEILNYNCPEIMYCTEGNIVLENTTPIVLKKGERCSRAGQ